MAEPIKMQFGLWTLVGLRNPMFDGGPHRPCKGAILNVKKGRLIVKHELCKNG